MLVRFLVWVHTHMAILVLSRYIAAGVIGTPRPVHATLSAWIPRTIYTAQKWNLIFSADTQCEGVLSVAVGCQ